MSTTDTLTWTGRAGTRPIKVGVHLQVRRRDRSIVFGHVTGIGSKNGEPVIDIDVLDVYADRPTLGRGDSIWAYPDQVIYVHPTR